MRRSDLTLALLLLLAGGQSRAARAGESLRILPGDFDLCVNGARFTARAVDAGALGIELTPEVWNGSATPLAGSLPVTFMVPGERAALVVAGPELEVAVGASAYLVLTDAPGTGTLGAHGVARYEVVEDCRLLIGGEFDDETPWTFEGGHDLLTDADFDWNDDPGDGGLGSFLLLSNQVVTAFDEDVDGNGEHDHDRAAAAQEFSPLRPCALEAFVGFYTSEAAQTEPYDDFWRVVLTLGEEEMVLGFSVPAPASFTSPYVDWPTPLVGGPYEILGSGPLSGQSFEDGSTAGLDLGLAVPAGAAATLTFEVYDQADQTVNSGILVDNVRCAPLLIDAAGFEDGDLVEWDGVVPAGP